MSALHAMLAGATGGMILLAGVASRDTKPVQELLGKSTEVRILARLGAIESELSSLSELESASEELAQQVQEISSMVDDLENDLDAVSEAVGADSGFSPTVLEEVQSIKAELNL